MDNICSKPSYKILAMICFLLAAITVAAFEQVRHCEFVYDDKLYITDPPEVMMGVTVKSILWALTSGFACNWHPLTWISHMLDCELFGFDPYWHHLGNLFFHVVNVLLLFWVLRKMTNAIWCSAFVAVLFAVHPLRVESVAWVAERKDLLSGLFFMLTIIFYVEYVKNRLQTSDTRPQTEKKVLEYKVSGLRSMVFYCLCLLSYILGLMSKPMLVTLPMVLLLLDYWPLGRFRGMDSPPSPDDGRKTALWHLVLEKGPLFVLSTVSSVITFMVQQPCMMNMERLSVNVRMGNAAIAYLSYISKIICPVGLAVLYPYPSEMPAWHVISSVLVLVFLTLCVVYLGKQRRYLITGWLWYLTMLVPVIGLVQVGSQAMADRYTYMPAIGFFIIIVWGAAELTSGWRWRKVILGACGAAVIVVLVICTRVQVRYWRDGIALYGRAISVTKNNYSMLRGLGYSFQVKGMEDYAIACYRQLLDINPKDVGVYNNLGEALRSRGKAVEAVDCFRQALQLSPEDASIHGNLGVALASLGRLDEAMDSYRRALNIDPDYAQVHNNLGAAFAVKGKLTEAIDQFRCAIKLDPNNPDAWNNLKNALKSQEETGKAAEGVLDIKTR